MKKLFITICFLSSQFVYSQINLVPNSSFEDTVEYSLSSNLLEDFIEDWRGGLGYFNINHTSWFGSVPANQAGNQYPRTGDAYCGIYSNLKYTIPIRQYIQTKLKQQLLVNKKYRVAFYVSLGDAYHANTNSIGAYFSADSFFVSYGNFTGLMNYTPQIQNDVHNDLSSKINWTLVCDTFIATGNERYITIGNFYNDSLSNITPLDSVCSMPNGFNCGAYYYIDDVSVELVDETGLDEQKQNIYTLYPNPNNGNFKLLCKTNEALNCTLKDVTGKIVFISLSKPINNSINFNFGSLSKGLYYLKLIDANEIIVIKVIIN